ncbi:Hypothetical predicted protein, partial [Mytilus galloprovincialis]
LILQLRLNLKLFKNEIGKRPKIKNINSLYLAQDIQKDSAIGLPLYYTSISKNKMMMSYKGIVEEGINPVNYKEKINEVKAMLLTDQLFLVLCRLRNGLHIKDLAYRFNIKPQSVSVIYKSVIYAPYIRIFVILAQRYYYTECVTTKQIRVSNMPCNYRLYGIKNNEIFITKVTESVLFGLQVINNLEIFADYRSKRFYNEICKESGFYKLLQQLKDQGYLQDNDGIMADKGFRIEKDLGELNLKLNIPPFESTDTQMSSGNVALTRKIAAHRIHIESLQTSPFCSIVVDGQKKSWRNGKVILFDDSYLHGVEYTHDVKDENKYRAVLMMDMWHLDITKVEQKILSYMFPP